MLLLETLDRNFPSARNERGNETGTWRDQQSYVAATGRLARAGIAVQPDGIGDYVAERHRWEPPVQRVAPTLGYGMEEIDRRRPQMRAYTSFSDGERA